MTHKEYLFCVQYTYVSKCSASFVRIAHTCHTKKEQKQKQDKQKKQQPKKWNSQRLLFSKVKHIVRGQRLIPDVSGSSNELLFVVIEKEIGGWPSRVGFECGGDHYSSMLNQKYKFHNTFLDSIKLFGVNQPS